MWYDPKCLQIMCMKAGAVFSFGLIANKVDGMSPARCGSCNNAEVGLSQCLSSHAESDTLVD